MAVNCSSSKVELAATFNANEFGQEPMKSTDKKPEMHSLPSHEGAYFHNVIELGGNKTIMCSVLFLDIVSYFRKSVSQQMELKTCLNNSLAAAISGVPVDDRIILDTGDGAAISFLGNMEDALRVALILRGNLLNKGAQLNPPLLVRSGINLGPVRLIKDINGQPNIVGDGINVAQRVMEFSQPGQILLSRSYYDAISNHSQEYAGMLHYHGKFTDKNVREHEVYAIKRGEEMEVSALGAGITREVSPDQTSGGNRKIFDETSSIFKKASSQPRVLIGGIILGVMLLVLARMIKVEPHASMPAQSYKMTTSQQVAKPAEMGIVSIAVTPWGEVYLDGKIQGISPPLIELELEPGNHKIEIRNKTSRNYSKNILVKAGEKTVIKYKFTDPLE